MPAEDADYRLEVADRRSNNDLTTTVSAAWTFRSGHTDGDPPVRLPLAAVRFTPKLDANNAAPAGRVFDLPVTVEGQPGAPAPDRRADGRGLLRRRQDLGRRRRCGQPAAAGSPPSGTLAEPATSPCGLPPGHLGELTQFIPFEMVDEVLAVTCRTQQRIRLLPGRVVVYLVLAACLFAELGYGQVWQKLTAGLTGLGLAEPSSGALREARQRLGSAPLRALFDLLRGPVATTATHAVRWRGLLVTAIDGTMMSVADAEAVRTRYRQQRGNHGGAGYPALRLSVLLTCGTRSIIDAVFDPHGTRELDQARSLAAGMLLLADRNYAAADLIRTLAATKADLLIRSRTAAASR